MICLRKRERALISVSLLLLFVSCRSQSDSVATEKATSESVISSTPPFQTREPDRYRATRVITTVTPDGKTIITRTSIARHGEMRFYQDEVASKKVAYLEVPAGRFAVLLDDRVYADLSAESPGAIEEGQATEVSPERLLHVDTESSSYQKLGTESIGGRNTNKYRVVVNSSSAANVSVSETLIWIDEALQMPIRSEMKSADGTRVTMELLDIALEVDGRLFQVPDDCKKIAYSEFQKLLKTN
jgi:outer membrane lipoprotein-sorting protein